MKKMKKLKILILLLFVHHAQSAIEDKPRISTSSGGFSNRYNCPRLLIGSLIGSERHLEYRLGNPHKATLFSLQVIRKIFHFRLEPVLLYMLVMKILLKLFPTIVIWNPKLGK